MTFIPNIPMDQTQSEFAIHLTKEAFRKWGRPYRVFSERRTQSRKLKFWGMTEKSYNKLYKLFVANHIHFYVTGFRSIVIDVPLHVTFANPLRNPL